MLAVRLLNKSVGMHTPPLRSRFCNQFCLGPKNKFPCCLFWKMKSNTPRYRHNNQIRKPRVLINKMRGLSTCSTATSPFINLLQQVTAALCLLSTISSGVQMCASSSTWHPKDP